MEKNQNKAWAFPPKSVDFWYHASVALALIAAAAILPVMFYIFSAAGNSDLVDERVKLTTALGTSLGVLLTFSTVVWRGLVGEFQAREQQRTNVLKAEENTAQLLSDGTNLISSQDDTRIAAGVAILGMVTQSTNQFLAQSAVEILAAKLAQFVATTTSEQIIDLTRATINRACEAGFASAIEINIDLNVYDDTIKALNIRGFANVNLHGGKIFYLDGADLNDNQLRIFNGTYFASVECCVSRSTHDNCHFHRCTIPSFGLLRLRGNKFVHCDFSRSTVRNEFVGLPFNAFDWVEQNKVSLENCYYFEDSPPTGSGAALLIPYLEPRKRPVISDRELVETVMRDARLQNEEIV